MSTPEERKDAAAELDAQLLAYVKTLSPAEALNLAGQTVAQIEEFAWNPRLDEPSLRLNAALFAALTRAFLVRIVTAGPFHLTEDVELFQGFADFMRVHQTRFAEAVGLGILGMGGDGR